ncbi:hypothetical protein PMAYCL1PPCAC_17922, partial [Pristionchus mayeri]
GAMELDRRQREFLSNVLVLHRLRPFDGLSIDPLSSERRRGDGRSASECLELRIDDLSIIIHFNLKLHDITAS